MCLAEATRDNCDPARAEIVERRLGDDSLAGVREVWPTLPGGRRRVLF